MKKIILFCSCIAVLFLYSCASSTNGNTDSSRFDLDKCSTTNTAACDSSISAADKVLQKDENNINAAMLKSAALATRGHIDLLNVMSKLSKTDDASDKFATIRDIIDLVTTDDLPYLREAISVMSGIVDRGEAPANGDIKRDFYFQLGILQAMEAFIRPIRLSQPNATDEVTVAATEAITDTEVTGDGAVVKADFLAADDNLQTGGIEKDKTGWDLVTAVRNNYCAIKKVAPVADDYTTAKLRAIMRCQLNTADIIRGLSSDNDDFPGTDITKCSDFTYTGCDNTPTE